MSGELLHLDTYRLIPMPVVYRPATEAELSDALQEVAAKFPITPRELQPDELPRISRKLSGPVLEIAFLERPEDSGVLFYGDTHGLIFPFLHEAVQRGVVKLPLGQILNIDYHADIAPYTELFTSHTPTWQRYGIENGLWSLHNSYNWQPEYSKAPPTKSFMPESYIQSVGTDEVTQLDPDVLSIDIDFFIEQEPDSLEFQNYMKVLKSLVKKSKCVLIFSSSGYTTNRLSIETATQIVTNIQETFLNNSATNDIPEHLSSNPV